MTNVQFENSVTCVGSDDDRTVESFRAENDALRDAINTTEKANLETETKSRTLLDEVAQLKLKIKRLMENKEESADISSIISLDDIAEVRAQLKIPTMKEATHKHSKSVSSNGQKKTPRDSTTAEPTYAKTQPKEESEHVGRKRNDGPVVQLDDGQQVRETLRNATTNEEITKAINKAKKLGLKHEQELGHKLLLSRVHA